jgi:putative tricarboxylic transport membrane protein
MKSVKGDIWLAIVVIVGAAIYLYMDVQLPEVRLSDPLGPKAFPALVGIGLLVSALLLLFEARAKARHPAPLVEAPVEAKAAPAAETHDEDAHASATDSASGTATKRPALVLIGMVLWTIAYYAAFDRAGYLISTMVFLIGLLSYFNRKRIKMNLAVAVGATVVFYMLFSHLLDVPMPRGILPF